MFRERRDFADLSTGLRDPDDWDIGRLRTVDYLLDTRVLTYEPILSLLAVGTASGLIIVIGGPGVECSVQTPEKSPVKILQLAASVDKLVSVDERNRLHIWDLKDLTKPPKSTSFDYAINAVLLSPSHTHVFLALQSGEIRSYDLLCLKKSSYVIPNLWDMFQTKIASDLVDPSYASPGCNIPVDVVAHPRDLNLMFIAFGGGIILYDLSSRNILRAYELVIPAGAPGGAGYRQSDVLTHRRPFVTSVAIHPAGHFFAVGYMDGCVAFWAIEDEDQPLLVRTTTDLDVNIINGEELDKFLQNSSDQENVDSLSERQPVYKVAWCGFPNSSDPRGGATALILLGGDGSDEPYRLTVQTMPAFDSPEPPASSNPNDGLHASIRKAMRLSVFPTETTYYPASGPIHDFILFPKSNPHFSGCWDPVAVLLLTAASPESRIVEARQFPPPSFTSPPPETNAQSTSKCDDVIHDLSATLKDMALSVEPLPIHVHSKLHSGGVFYTRLLTLQRNTHDVFVGQQPIHVGTELPIIGGSAWMDDKRLSDLRFSKSHPRRVLVSCHRDYTVRFHDVSPQLLISSSTSPLQQNYPCPLHDLTIDLSTLPLSSVPEVATVQVASESLECVVLLKSGDLLVYRLNCTQSNVAAEAKGDNELILLDNVILRTGTRYRPYVMLPRGNTSLTCCALSNIGFIGVGYIDGSVAVIDLRGPSLLRLQHQKRQSNFLVRHQDADSVISLTWTIAAVSMDTQLAVRLIAIHESGKTQIFKISQDPKSELYIFAQDDSKVEGLPNVLQEGSFVIDSQKGTLLDADRSRFAASLQPEIRDISPDHCFWVMASVKGARCVLDISGERIAKADWNNKKNKVGHVQVIERNKSHVLVAFNDKPEAVVYSLPYLEHLHTFSLAEVCETVVSVDETGDFIGTKLHKSGVLEQIIFGTLFKTRRVYDYPVVDLTSFHREISPYPQPVPVGPPSLLGSWLRYGKPSMTGKQLDELLAGPDRPTPPSIPVQSSQETSASDRPGLMKTMGDARNDVYQRLSNAVAERGEMLGDIEQRLDSLQQGSKDMVAQAKRLATEQGTRRWFGF